MAVSLKPISEQVIVITGASSGIGLATAEAAARAGAKVVLTARNETALAEAAKGISEAGGEAAYVAADVASRAELQRVPTRRSSASGDSTPGSTTPGCRSGAGSKRSAMKIIGGCSRPTSGEP